MAGQGQVATEIGRKAFSKDEEAYTYFRHFNIETGSVKRVTSRRESDGSLVVVIDGSEYLFGKIDNLQDFQRAQQEVAGKSRSELVTLGNLVMFRYFGYGEGLDACS